ncbi:MAG TPA: peptidyl-prolyl cis-trans isomerase [Terracidiphilus sp.]|jgi:parvulin-like peptidyl-prolyl isomerase
MKHKALTSALLVLALQTAGAQVASHAPTALKQPPAQSSNVVALTAVGKPVARVNGAVLTDVDLVREEYAIFPYAKQHNGLPRDLAPQIRDGALKMIIFEELVYQEAQRRKLVIPAARMQRAEADFRKQFATPDEFKKFLQSDFQGSAQRLREKVTRSLLIEALLKQEVDSKCVSTPAELKAFYDKSARFSHPETYTFQTISILPPSNATAQQLKEGKARADAALKQAKAAKTAEAFGMLAEKLSDDDYRVVLGQHKPLPADQLAPPVLKAFKTMKPGDVTDILQLDQAYTIVRLNAHTPAGKTPFAEVRTQLQKELTESKRNQLRMALDKKLRQGAKVDEL